MPFDLKLLSTINCNQQEECLITAHPLSDLMVTLQIQVLVRLRYKLRFKYSEERFMHIYIYIRLSYDFFLRK